jgi:4-hydroxy-2-oxoheptanedioate aldolase
MNDEFPNNRFKAALRHDRALIGFWLNLMSPTVTEIAAGAGFDWLLIDMEHTANDLSDILGHLRAVDYRVVEPVVRVPSTDPALVKRLLDLGARTILFPFIQSADEARVAVSATRYPPYGVRGVSGASRANGYGRIANYFARASDNICVLVQVETRDSLQNVDAIARVEGVDGVFIGPSDLAADWGFPGEWRRPEILNAILAAAVQIRGAGKAAGFLSLDEQESLDFIAAGFKFLAVGVDSVVIAKQTEAISRSFM